MRILLEWPRSSVYDPTSFPGGVEKWVTHTFNVLRTAHEVRLLVPNDSVVSDPDVILGPLPSRPYDKTKSHSYKFRPFYEFIETIVDEFDVIIMTSIMGSGTLRKEFEHLCPKIVYFQHYYDLCSPNVPNFTAWYNQLAIIQAGGKVLTPNDWVRNEGKRCFDLRRNDMFTLKRIHDWEREKWDGTYESSGLYNGSFDIIHNLDDAVEVKEVNPKKVVFIGRPVEEKGIIEASKVLMELDKQGYECHVFTRDENLSKQKTEDVMELLKRSGVHLHINTPHSEIMQELADTHILLWPTRKETVGIVGYEGAIHGCKVIYKIDPPDYYLKDWAFKREWKTWQRLLEVVQEVENAEFDREATIAHFRDTYTIGGDLRRLEKVLCYG